jgi:hypothetical protein
MGVCSGGAETVARIIKPAATGAPRAQSASRLTVSSLLARESYQEQRSRSSCHCGCVHVFSLGSTSEQARDLLREGSTAALGQTSQCK